MSACFQTDVLSEDGQILQGDFEEEEIKESKLRENENWKICTEVKGVKRIAKLDW